MKFDQTNRKDLRDLFCNAITKVFGDSMIFLDFRGYYYIHEPIAMVAVWSAVMGAYCLIGGAI